MSIAIKSDQSLVDGDAALAGYLLLLESLDTPVSLGVYLQLKNGMFDDYVNRKIDPIHYNSAASFKLDYQAVKGLQKAAFLPTSFKKRVNALEKFWKAEESCGLTNRKFDSLMYEGGNAKLLENNPRMFRTLSRARNQILRILGPVPQELDRRFGPGVTSLVKRDVTLPQKYSHLIHVTPELSSSVPQMIGPNWADHVTDVKLVTGGVVSFVPKNAKTDRAIAVEPHANVYQQLGLGQALRGRLRKWIDLSKGQEVNRFLASQAHDWDLCTVDLESASDTIASSLIWYLLPEEWAEVLDQARSHRFVLDKKVYTSEKFSSMGNGFTFELETIIFYSLALACGSHRALTSCYGDDIIAESRIYQDLKEVLEFCGFTVNLEKTFSRGSFFESCGEDFFLGVNVRPRMWKELKPGSLFKFMNDVSKIASRFDGTRDIAFLPAFKHFQQILPRDLLHCRVPFGYGDVGIHASWDEVKPSIRRNENGWCGFRTKALKYRPRYKVDIFGSAGV